MFCKETRAAGRGFDLSGHNGNCPERKCPASAEFKSREASKVEIMNVNTEPLLSLGAQYLLRDVFVGWRLVRAGSSWVVLPSGARPAGKAFPPWSGKMHSPAIGEAIDELVRHGLMITEREQGVLTPDGSHRAESIIAARAALAG